MDATDFRFCPFCAGRLEARPVGGRLRPTCLACGFVHYRNPAVGVAVIVRRPGDGAVLLGRRTGSYRGRWCIPCGYVEWDEDVCEAARREFEEETGLRVRLTGVYAVHSNFHDPARQTVGVWFTGEVEGGELCPGNGLDDVRFFPLDALPEDLAFPTDRLVLERLRHETLTPSPLSREREGGARRAG